MATYFVDATLGLDTNDGLSEATPWKTISKVNNSTFVAGDTISFKAGETWTETLTIPSEGTSGSVITFTSYGSGNAPIIDAEDTRNNCINLNDKDYVTIRNLKLIDAKTSCLAGESNEPVTGVTATGLTISGALWNGITFTGSNNTISNCTISDCAQRGINIVRESGTIEHTGWTISGCTVSDIAQEFAGVGILLLGQGTISDCNVSDVGTDGILIEACDSGWAQASGDTVSHVSDTREGLNVTVVKTVVTDTRSQNDPLAYKDISTLDISAGGSIGFWIKSDTALPDSALKVVVSETAGGGDTQVGTNGTDYILTPTNQLEADTWTFVAIVLNFTVDAAISVTLFANTTITSTPTIYLDDIRSYPQIQGINVSTTGVLESTVKDSTAAITGGGGNTGIYIGGTDGFGTLNVNRCTASAGTGQLSSGIKAAHGTIVATNCVAKDSFNGISAKSFGNLDIKNCTITNISGPRSTASTFPSTSCVRTTDDDHVVTIRNSILDATNAETAISANTLSEVVMDSDYNCIVAGKSAVAYDRGTDTNYTEVTWKGLGYEANSIFDDPEFAGFNGSDYSLKKISPCKKKGIDIGVTTDFDSTTRISPPDIGAYELELGGLFLCNRALSEIGAKQIDNLDGDTSEEAIQCRLHYEPTRDALQRSHFWRFASARAELTESSTSPLFEFDNQFDLPSDFERLKSIYGDSSRPLENTRRSFAIEGDKILTNESAVDLRYIKLVSDVTKFDSLFEEVLVLTLALKLVPPLAGGAPKLQEKIQTKLVPLMRKVRTLDRQETNNRGRNDQPIWNDQRFQQGNRIDSQLGN